MQKTTLFIALIALIIGITLWSYSFNEKVETGPSACTMEALICPDGTSVGRTGPNCSFAPCPESSTTTPVRGGAGEPVSKDDLIIVESPQPNTAISSPITVKGEARGYWFFEASFPISIVDGEGRVLGSGIATADGEWMTENYVPFTATIAYALPQGEDREGKIILKKDNPSGLPERDDSLEIPITFK